MLTIFSAGAANAANSSLSLSGKDSVLNSTTTTERGNVVDWVLGYKNLSGSPASTQVHNVIPANTTYVPNSLQAPSSWTKNYSSNNESSYGVVDTGVSTTDIQLTAQVPSGGPGSGQAAPQPISATQQSGTGFDAYMPIPYGDRTYAIVHHSTEVGMELVCSLRAGGSCPGFPLALNVSGQTDFFTSINPMHYVDTSGRLFFAVQRSVGFGVFCYDLAAGGNCSTPYTQWSAAGAVLGSQQPSRVLGVIEENGCLYGWDTNLVMYSFDPTNFATVCGAFGSRNLASGYSIPTYNPSTHNLSSSNYGPVASAQVIGGKVYFPVNYSFNDDLNLFCGFGSTNYCENSRLVCFDPLAASGVCSSWIPPSLGGANTPAVLATTVFNDVTNNRPCTVVIDVTPGTYSSNLACFNAATGASVADPANFQSNLIDDARAISGESGSNIYLMASYEEVTSTLPNGHTVTVMPFTKFGDLLGNAIRGGAGCYDWTIADECLAWGSSADGETNWTAWGSSTAVNAGNTRDYGYAVDDAGCLLGLGDAGWLWSFNVDDASVPCRRSVSESTVTPSSFYCDGEAGHISGWDEVRVSNIALGDFSSILVTIKDSNGDIVSGYDGLDILPGGGVLDISTIPYSGNTQDISVTVTLVAQNDNPWSGVQPYVGVTFNGDDAQICFQTTVTTECSVTEILNESDAETIQLSDSSTHISTANSTIAVSGGNNCPATVASSTGNASNSPTAQLASTGSGRVIQSIIFGLVLVLSAVGLSYRRKFSKSHS